MKKRMAQCILPVTALVLFGTAFAAAEEDPAAEGGYVIVEASQENLSGEYGEAYEAAGYQATFTYVADEDEDIASIEIYGDFQWFTEEDAEALLASDFADRFHARSAYEYTADSFSAGFGNPGGAGDYPEGVRFDGYVYYTMTETSGGVYQVTMPMPAGLYRYQYSITDSQGNITLSADPCVEWNYTIEEDSDTPATWSLFYAGSADEVSESESYAYPIEDDSLKGSVETAEVTTIIGTEQAIQVYLPYDYDENDPEPYRTLYVSHGGSENERTWMTIGALPNIMDHLVAEGAVDHTIAVTMDNNVALNVFDTDILADNFQDYLIPYIEENYNVSADSADRAFCGTSWGGITALYIMAEHPELMQAYGVFSVGFEYDLTTMLADSTDVLKDREIFLTVGNLESYAGPTVQSKYENLLELGLEDSVTYEKYDGAHDWRNWHAAIRYFIYSLGWNE